MNKMISYTVTDIYEGPSGIYCVFKNNENEEKHTLLFRISDYYDAHLAVGDTVSDESFEGLFEVSNTATAIIKAQKILSQGDHSKKGLVLKLIRSDIERRYAEKAAIIMEEQGFINEDDQAELLARAYCRRKYWGKKRITQELLSKGYEKSAVTAAVSFVSPEEYKEALMTVIDRKYPDPPEDKKEKDRRIAALLRLGYSLSEIMEGFRESY